MWKKRLLWTVMTALMAAQACLQMKLNYYLYQSHYLSRSRPSFFCPLAPAARSNHQSRKKAEEQAPLNRPHHFHGRLGMCALLH